MFCPCTPSMVVTTPSLGATMTTWRRDSYSVSSCSSAEILRSMAARWFFALRSLAARSRLSACMSPSKARRLRCKLCSLLCWSLTVRVFSKWFVRNGAKPSIHPRREAQQLQNPLLERAESRQMAIDLMHSLNHRQRHLLKRFKQSLRCRSSRFALAIAGIKTRESFPCGRQLTTHHELQQRQDPQGNRYQPHQPGGMVVS